MGQYKSQYTGPQIDAGVNAALNPDVTVTPDSDALVTSGAVADALDNIDPTITSNTDTTLNGILVGDGSKVGTKSLDTSSLTNDGDHVPVSSVVKSALMHDLANIVATGATNTTGAIISSGTYFYLDGALVQAKENIGIGAPFTSGTNYAAVTAGGLNALKAAINAAPQCIYQYYEYTGTYTINTGSKSCMCLVITSPSQAGATEGSGLYYGTIYPTNALYSVVLTAQETGYKPNTVSFGAGSISITTSANYVKCLVILYPLD